MRVFTDLPTATNVIYLFFFYNQLFILTPVMCFVNSSLGPLHIWCETLGDNKQI